jgi:uncharacterized repeat protein (TIGR03803 family)
VKASWAADATYAAATATQTTTAYLGYNESVIWNFGQNGWPDGIAPAGNGLVFDAAGNLYATVIDDGGTLNGDGAVVEFSLKDGVWTETVLYVFNRLSTGFTGYHPVGTLAMDSKGNLYGVTTNGGTGGCTSSGVPPSWVGCGAVYELSPPTEAGGVWTAKGLYSFQGSGSQSSSGTGTDGFWPFSGVTLASASATTLYGTTTCGGTGMLNDEGDTCGDSSGGGLNANGAGTVYELTYSKTTAKWSETVLYSFSGNGASNGGADGWYPESGLLLKSGNLYGTTCHGGPPNHEAGTVYELKPGVPWTETVLHSFNGTDGACPMYGTPVMDTESNLYGTTNEGGTVPTAAGTAWELKYDAGTYNPTATVLYSFGSQATDGTNPSWGLVSYKGSWYGTTGGWQSGQFGATYGTAFKLTYSAATGWQEKTLWTFNGQSDTDIGSPGWNQLVVDKDGNFYGMAPIGPDGVAQGGGVFELSPK